MSDAEDKITVHNLQVEYDRLTQDIPKKAGELSLIYKDIERAKSEFNKINSDKNIALKEVEQSRQQLQEDIASFNQRTAEFEQSKIDKASEIKDLDSKHKQAVKELSRVNAQVLHAEEEYAKYQELIKDSDTKRDELLTTLAKIDKANEMLVFLEGEKTRVLEDISTSHEVSEGKLKAAREELGKLIALADQKRIEASKAEYALKTYTDQLYKHMNDYQVVKSRLEGIWKKTFPELDLPLE